MSPTCRQLFWMSAISFLCSCGVTAGDLSLSISPPQTNSSTFVGLNGYRRYFANDSLIGRPVPCTRDDKICFRQNLVFDPIQERCLPLGIFEGICILSVDKKEYKQESGRVTGSCRTCIDPCTGYRMAYDSLCYDKEIVHDVICGPEANVTRHPFGDSECRSAPATPITVQQPEDDNSCVIPDLRFPNPNRDIFYKNPLTSIQGFKNDVPRRSYTQIPLQCASDQAACFSEGKVFVSGYEGCHTLLEQGPCAEDHVVALDVQAANESRAEGVCVHVRGGCPKGYKRMIFDGQCHEDREIELEALGSVILNQFGKYIVVFDDESLRFIPTLKKDKCTIFFYYIRITVLHSDILDTCEFGDEAEFKHKVISEPPMPEG